MRSSGVVEGPEAVAANARSFTGRYLAPMLGKQGAVSERVSEAAE